MENMMNQFRAAICAAAFLCWVMLPSAAHAQTNLALEWNQTAEAVVKQVGEQPARGRTLLIGHMAMFNALNAIVPRFTPFTLPGAPALDAAPHASPEAAAASAMFTALAVQPGVDHVALTKAYSERIQKVTDRAAREAGIALGRTAALRLLAARSADALGHIDPATLEPAPGRFAIPPDRKTRASVATARLQPFAIKSLAAYDPGPPPVATSEVALSHIREIKAVGAAQSTTRTADQTAAALFWNSSQSFDDFVMTVQARLEARKLAPVEVARILALDWLIDMDARIAEVAFKEKYGQWRPETAIAGPHAHASLRDAEWKPLTRTPSQEEYPGGFAVLGGMLSVMLPRLYDVQTPIVWRNPGTGQTRTWTSVPVLTQEIAYSRLWTGAHFRYSIDAGYTLGQRIAKHIIDQQLLPLAK
jgi:hypothetical protein